MPIFSKSFAFGLALPYLFFPASLHAADSGSMEFTLRGTAQPICALSEPSTTSQVNASVVNKMITIENLVDQQNAKVQPFAATLTFPGVMCNYPARIGLQSTHGAMMPIGNIVVPVGGNFLKQVHYIATAKWGSVPELTLSTATLGIVAVQQAAAGANKADLIISISAPASTDPLVQGEFQDTLIISIGPGV